MRSCKTVALLAIACACEAHAASAPAERVRQFATLPDWSGVWQSAAWDLDVSGRPKRGEAELRETLQLIRPPPYNAKWQPIYAAKMADTKALAQDAATINVCTRSFPAIMEAPWMLQIAVLPEETLLVFENDQVRHVHTDGRKHPAPEDLWPTRLGDSVGHWDGDTLVIDTVARKPGPLAPRAPFAELSERAHFTERLRRVAENEIDDELTIADPETLAHDWHIALKFKRLPEMDRLFPYDCTENDRNPVVNGEMKLLPPR